MSAHKKIMDDDEGELGLAVTVENNVLIIIFQKKVDWIGLDKATADRFIAMLSKKAEELT